MTTFGIDSGDDLYLKEGAYVDAYGGFVHLGTGVVLGQYSAIHGDGGVTAGNYVMIGHGALILAGNHNHRIESTPFLFQGSTKRGIRIGSNVWIGANAVILDGSTIEDDVVIGAGCIIRGSVPAGTLVYHGAEMVFRRLENNTS